MIKFLHRLNALGDARWSGLNSKLKLNHVVHQRGVESILCGHHLTADHFAASAAVSSLLKLASGN